MDDRKDVEMKFVCPHSWETLEPTSSDDNEKEARFCADCSKDVYWCSSEEEMKSHGVQGHCVAFNFARGVDPSHPSDDDFLLTPLNEALTSSDKKISSDEVSEHLNTIDPRDADERRWLYYTDGEEINGPVSRSELEPLRYSSPTIFVWGEGECNWVDLAYFYEPINLDDDNYGQGTVGVLADPHGPDYLRRKELAALRKELAALRVVYVNSLRMIGSGVIGFAFGSIALPFLPMLFVIYTVIMSSIVGSAWIVQRYRLTHVLNKIDQEKKRREKIHAQMPPLPGSISSSINSSEIKERIDAINHKRGNQMLIILIGAFGIGCAFMAAGFILMFWIFTLTLLLGTTLTWLKNYRENIKKYVKRAAQFCLLEPPPENGPHIEYHENGKKKLEEHYKNGKKKGLQAKWYENGQKKYEAHYKNGKLDGLSTGWEENGQKARESHYKDGKEDGLQAKWYENGQKFWEIHYKNGKKEGLDTWWHENGQKKLESHYKNGKPEGLTTDWYENGQKKSEVHYKNGKRDGLGTGWYENGQKFRETHYKNGKKDGLGTEWWKNGKKKEELHYKNGKRDGLVTGWYENGQKEWEYHYKDGKEDGLTTFWDENGQKSLEILYKNGKEVSRKEF